MKLSEITKPSISLKIAQYILLSLTIIMYSSCGKDDNPPDDNMGGGGGGGKMPPELTAEVQFNSSLIELLTFHNRATLAIQSTMTGKLYFGALPEGSSMPTTISEILENLIGIDSAIVPEVNKDLIIHVKELERGTTYIGYAALVTSDGRYFKSPIAASSPFTTLSEPPDYSLDITPGGMHYTVVDDGSRNEMTLTFLNDGKKAITVQNSRHYPISRTVSQEVELRINPSMGEFTNMTLEPGQSMEFSFTTPFYFDGRVGYYIGVNYTALILSNFYPTDPSKVGGGLIKSYIYFNVIEPVMHHRIYVDVNASGANNGSSWANAYRKMEDALKNAHDISTNFTDIEIWVAGGTYRVPGQTFFIGRPMRIYGGFTGNETALSERDWNQNRTILDGGGTALHVLSIYPNKGYPLVLRAKEMILDGFDITGGNANRHSNRDSHGGGIRVGDASRTFIASIHVKLYNLRVYGNKSSVAGAAMMSWYAPLTIVNTLFINNVGGSMAVNQSNTNRRSVVRGNIIQLSPGGSAPVQMINCVIVNNTFGPETSRTGHGVWIKEPAFITNSIAWGGDANRIFGFKGLAETGATVEYSLLEHAPAGDVLNTENNIIGNDPLFVNLSEKNACVQSGSPAVNAGNNSALDAVRMEVTKDIAGRNARFINRVDMGVCEQ